MYIEQTLSAGVAVEYSEAADFFRMMAAPQQDATIIFYKQGKEVSRAVNVGAGYAERFPGEGIDRVRIVSTAGGAFAFVMRLGGDVRYDSPVLSGNVSVSNLPATKGAFTQANATVTNASGTLIAADAARRYLLIQNNDAAGVIYVTLDGQTATTALGLKISAGGTLELQGYVCTGAVKAIGSIASNANVVTVVG